MLNIVERDRGSRAQEKRGREACGRCAGGVREARVEGAEAGFLRWWEVGEIQENYTTLHNILQWKKCKEAGAKKSRVGRVVHNFSSSWQKFLCSWIVIIKCRRRSFLGGVWGHAPPKEIFTF